MKKIIIPTALSGLLVFTANVFAGSLIMCPQEISCNYSTGKCTYPKENSGGYGAWHLATEYATVSFQGEKTIRLTNIQAEVRNTPTKYAFFCIYKYAPSSYVYLSTGAKLLTGGNWTFSGFGNEQPFCETPTNPAGCTGQY